MLCRLIAQSGRTCGWKQCTLYLGTSSVTASCAGQVLEGSQYRIRPPAPLAGSNYSNNGVQVDYANAAFFVHIILLPIVERPLSGSLLHLEGHRVPVERPLQEEEGGKAESHINLVDPIPVCYVCLPPTLWCACQTCPTGSAPTKWDAERVG